MLLNRIRNRMRALGRARQILRTYEPTLKDHPDFDVARGRSGFEQKGSVPIRDEHLQRILVAYQKAKASQPAAPEVYQVSNEWLPIYRDQFQPSIDLMMSGNKNKTRRMFENFFRDGISTGLHGMPTNMHAAYFSGRISNRDVKLYLVDALFRLSIWQELMPSHSPAELVRPDIGNPYGFWASSNFITPGAEYQHYYAHKTVALMKDIGQKTILELGGGYGGFAYFLKSIESGARYIDIDLPEVLALSTFYLMTAYPDAKFVLHGEHEGPEIPDFDFWMIPNFDFGVVSPGSVDLVFNSYSLGEMAHDTIEAYVAHFSRISPKHIMHINHVKFAVRSAEAFGLEHAGFRLKEREPTRWNLGRQLDMDEDMFLYENIA